MKKYQYFRCPCCGKLSRARNFHSSIPHALEVMEQEIGGRRHIAWTHKSLSRDHVYIVYLRVKAVCKRLEDVLNLNSVPARGIQIPSIGISTVKVKPMEVRIDGKKIG